MPPRSFPARGPPASTAYPSRRRPAACVPGWRPAAVSSRALPGECVVNGFEHQAPLVLAALGLPVPPRGTGRPPPLQHVVEPLSLQRAFAIDRGHQRLGMTDAPAHRGVPAVARSRRARLVANRIPLVARAER